MSLDHVQAFYQKVADDDSFRSKIQSVNNKEECSEIVKAAGFDFTAQEFEEYTAQLLEQDRIDHDVTNLKEEDLVAVAGGLVGGLIFRPMYGLPVRPPTSKWPPISTWPPIVRPMYGLPGSPQNLL